MFQTGWDVIVEVDELKSIVVSTTPLYTLFGRYTGSHHQGVSAEQVSRMIINQTPVVLITGVVFRRLITVAERVK